MGKTRKIKGTKTQLEYVEKDFKLHVQRIKCKNERQKTLIKEIENKPVIFVSGFAGTGKSFISIYSALKALEKGLFKKIILIKSVQPIRGQDIAAIPGSEQDKISPFMESYRIILDDLLGEEQRKEAEKQGLIIYKSPTFLRGVTISDSIVIIDESQQFDDYLLTTIISRIGQNSKMIFLGDEMQVDIKRSESSFAKWVNTFENDEKVGCVRFLPEDCVRNPIITYILNKITNNLCQQNTKEKNQEITDGTNLKI